MGERAVRCPHSAPSAAVTADILKLYALAILGHHAGLPDFGESRQKIKQADPKSVQAAKDLLSRLEEERGSLNPSSFPERELEAEMRVRFAFSTLVDADYLDTEKHFCPQAEAYRFCKYSLATLKALLDARLNEFDPKASEVNRIRSEVLQACREAAKAKPCFYRLTVPTGGGKTLSSLAFALDHCLVNGLDRVIYAIPYTSIIDQTATVFAEVLGEEAVLEHHSDMVFEDPDRNDAEESRMGIWRKLAVENWDAPIIVTTTVQLFESLLSNKPSRCRKLHNIAHSVIILDEVQTLPTEVLDPTIDVLDQLVRVYKCSVVFCTATQPDYRSLESRAEKHTIDSLKGAKQIVKQYEDHYVALKRVNYEEFGELSADELSLVLAYHPQILCILNSRKDAVNVARACKRLDGVFHLSTLMCPHHRKAVLAEVKERLKGGKPVRLVSTQVVEAGVDLDFPIVMRDIGPLDRIVQAAGRCNREGKMQGKGRCLLFKLSEGRAPKGSYKTATELTASYIEQELENLDAPEVLAGYYRDWYKYVETDSKKVQEKRKRLSYEEVARAYRLIDSDTVEVVAVGYQPEDRPDHINELLSNFGKMPPRAWRQSIRQYCVALPRYEYDRFERQGEVKPHFCGIPLFVGTYDNLFGIGSGQEHDPADLIA